jgi:hypothetical protein
MSKYTHRVQGPPQQSAMPQMVSLYDPYVYQTLQSVRGAKVLIETIRGSVRGMLRDVKPDHVVVSSHDHLFFIRMQQIIWVMPQAH